MSTKAKEFTKQTLILWLLESSDRLPNLSKPIAAFNLKEILQVMPKLSTQHH
ncbi:hypothetical protein ACKFKF_11905 [Phormidesmis sp. 146-12]